MPARCMDLVAIAYTVVMFYGIPALFAFLAR